MLVQVCIACSYLLGLTITARAVRGGYLSQYGFFFSYLIYFLVSGAVALTVYFFAPEYFVTLFWLRFITLGTAEFALLLEIGDHIFSPYPALRHLGRLVTLGIALLFSILYILPPLLEDYPSDVAILGLVKRSALTKGIIILLLLAAARYCRITLGRNIAGITLGLMAYLAIHTSNFALAESFGRARYAQTFGLIGPLSQTLTLLIWSIALWRYQPAAREILRVAETAGEIPAPSSPQLGQFHTALTRLLRR